MKSHCRPMSFLLPMGFSQGNLGDSTSSRQMETRGRDSILMPSIRNFTYYHIWWGKDRFKNCISKWYIFIDWGNQGKITLETKIIILCTVLTALLERDALPRHAGLKVIFEQLKYCCPDSINNHIFNYYGKCSNYHFRNSFSFFFLNVTQKGLGE